jgi:hypothetical protein
VLALNIFYFYFVNKEEFFFFKDSKLLLPCNFVSWCDIFYHEEKEFYMVAPTSMEW